MTGMSVVSTQYCVSDGSILAIEDRQVPFVPFPFGYLRIEFPSECWDFPIVARTTTDFLEQFFVKRLPKDSRVEHVYWFSENDTLKIWTVIPEPDFSLERPIYEAQTFFMEKFPEYECDFSVIYRFGKSLSNIKPHGSYQVL